MAFITTTETAGKERNKLCKEIVAAVRELIRQKTPDEDSMDMMAFIALSLLRIFETIDETVLAWEKRDYWIKAERFRQEWSWTASSGNKMLEAVKKNDFAGAAILLADIAQRFSSVKLSENHRLGKPWIGSYAKIK